MERKIQHIGGSLAIIIPKTLSDIHKLEAGMKLRMRETNEGLLVEYPQEGA